MLLNVSALGKNIKQFREAAEGVSQEDLGNAVGVGQGTVSKWEKGHGNPSILSMPRIAVLIHASLDDLFRGVDPEYDRRHASGAHPKRQREVQALDGPMGHELLERWKQLRTKDQRAIIGIVRALLRAHPPPASAEGSGGQGTS